MRALACAVTVAAASCATAPAPATPSPTAPRPVELQERAAALFDAAAHGDELRLKTLVDWTRWRLVEGLAEAADDAAAAQLLSRVEAEPQPSAATMDAAARALVARLARAGAGPMPPRAQPGTMNATLARWRRGPSADAAPSLARLQTLVAEALDEAREVTYEGARRVTLVFVGDRLVGIVEAR
jgi:hypothetical protein